MIWTKWDYRKMYIIGILILSLTVFVCLKAAFGVPNEMTTDSYSFTVIDPVGPYTDGHNPAKNATNISPGSNIIVHVKDDGLGVDINTIVMMVNGQVVNPDISGTKEDYTLNYNPSEDFLEGSTIYVTVDANDLN